MNFMKLQNLERLDEAPECGHMLAYTRKKVLFQEYRNREELRAVLGDEELLELHLFNAQEEYRSVVSESERFRAGVIEAVIKFPKDDERFVYKEDVLLEGQAGTIAVLNHIAYDENNGMAYVDNYRLQM